jgi:alanyl-tRNA synthetase
LGEHVTQKGSLCDSDKLRFDFSHFEGVTAKELQAVEQKVNDEIRRNHNKSTESMYIEEAKEKGAMALFGEKYDDEVRVVTLGDFSIELCGGVHVNRTGDIGLLKIVSESGVAAGVRRIEAFTGQSALTYTNQQASSLTQIASLVKSDVSNVNSKVEALISRSKHLEKQVSLLKQELAAQAGSDLLNQAITIEGIKVLIADLGGVESKALRGMVDELKNKMHSGIIMLATTNGAKVGLIAGVTKDLTSRVKAGELVNMVAEQVGGKGGGRPDMAQAGGSIPENITEALASVSPWLQEKLR